MASIWKLYLSLLPEPDCGEQFERVGCFRDDQIVPRPVPDYIMTDRQKNLAIYSGQSIDWRNWDVYMPQFLCRCAKEAKEKGYTIFGVQFYGKQIKIQRLRLACTAQVDSVFRADRQSAIQHWEAQEKQDVVISVRFHFASNETCLVNAETITTRTNPKAAHEVNAESFFFILFLCFAILKLLGRVTNLATLGKAVNSAKTQL